jgi:hypothetical protein
VEDEAALRRRARVRTFLFPGAGFGVLGYSGWCSFGFTVLWALTLSVVWLAFYPSPEAWGAFVGCAVLGNGFFATEYFAVRKLPILDRRQHNLSTRHFGVVAVVSYISLAAAAAYAGFNIQMH